MDKRVCRSTRNGKLFEKHFDQQCKEPIIVICRSEYQNNHRQLRKWSTKIYNQRPIIFKITRKDY